jgi:hypothetical protein
MPHMDTYKVGLYWSFGAKRGELQGIPLPYSNLAGAMRYALSGLDDGHWIVLSCNDETLIDTRDYEFRELTNDSRAYEHITNALVDLPEDFPASYQRALTRAADWLKKF